MKDGEENLTAAIAAQLYEALDKLGAPSSLQQIIAGYGDPLSDREMLERLRVWNDRNRTTPTARAEAEA